MKFAEFFHALTDFAPFPYQRRLATEPWPDLIDIPTGLGKTAALIAAFLWKRQLRDPNTGCRLVYCLPMRSLVEQTHQVARDMCSKAQAYFPDHDIPSAHVLMGGDVDNSWEREPLATRILIGTQDMLLSRALNRGYSMSPYKWPVHFGLLANDALWALDETQLIGVGIETTAQLSAFRKKMGTFGPNKTIWMSATLGKEQLCTVDNPEPSDGFAVAQLDGMDKDMTTVVQRVAARKSLQSTAETLQKATERSYSKTVATEILALHQKRGGLTLVVVNRVDRAQQIYKALTSLDKALPIGLIHSRFRPRDRRRHEELLFGKTDRIIVATQAIEAGVDVSANTLVTELCPWPSFVQRLGRLNRYGEQEEGQAYWIDIQWENEKSQLALPYTFQDLATARALISSLEQVGPTSLGKVAFTPPFVVRPVLRRKDLLDVFDTTADLSGYSIDVSRFIRDNDDSDVQIYFRNWEGDIPTTDARPSREELFRVSIGAGRNLLKALTAKKKKTDGNSAVWTAWSWNPLHNAFEAVTKAWAGQVWMLHPQAGGYSDSVGYTGELGGKHLPTVIQTAQTQQAETMSGDPDTAQIRWVELTSHLGHVESEASAISPAIPESLAAVVRTAARWHDVGKAHPVFQERLVAPVADDPEHRPPRDDALWAKSNHEKRHTGTRKHFRHELASALAWLQAGQADSEFAFNLTAYLIAAHHGKVRLSIRSLPDEARPPDASSRYARGVWEGDLLPPVQLPTGETIACPPLSLTCMELGQGSWAERMLGLRDHDELGPFRLAYLELLVRIADWTASQKEQEGGYDA